MSLIDGGIRIEAEKMMKGELRSEALFFLKAYSVKIYLKIFSLLIIFGTYNSLAQEIKQKNFFFGYSLGIPSPMSGLKAFGGTIDAEYMITDVIGIVGEYSSTHIYGSDKWNIFQNADVTFSGPGLLLCYHIFSSKKDFEVAMSLGASYTKANGTFGKMWDFFGTPSNKAAFLPDGRIGLRWWANDYLAVQGGFSLLQPLYIGFDYSP